MPRLLLAGILLAALSAPAPLRAEAPAGAATPAASPSPRPPPPPEAAPPRDRRTEDAHASIDALFGPQRWLVERVEIRGNDRTRDALIRRAVRVRPGRVLDEREVQRSRTRVLALGLFKRVDMRLERGSARGRVVLVVDVEERPTLMVSDLFLGFTDVSPFYGGFGLSDANLFGSGLLASGAFVVGSDGRWAGRASLHDPAFLHSDVVVGLTGTWIQGVEVDCALGLGQCASPELDRLRYRRAGGILSVGLRTGRTARVYVHYRAEGLDSRVEPGALRPGDGTLPVLTLPDILPGSSFLSTLAVSYEHDTRNDPFIASRGTRVVLSVEVASKLFFADYDYSRYQVSLAHYLPSVGDQSLRLSLFGGLVQGNAPFFDRFSVADHSYFTVGANTVPRALELSFTDVSAYDDILVSGDVTYQIPLFSGGGFLYRGYLYVGAAVTLSAHTVDRSLLDLSVDPRNEVSRFPLSGDVGLRVDTSVGVFNLGLSYPLDLLF